MLVSIITVVLNSEDTLRECLNSVRSQSYDKIEHIIVDGGSTDGSLQVINELENHDVIMISEPDNGIYDAINKGLKLASGDLVRFLNADDVFSSIMSIEKIVYHASIYNVDGVYGNLTYVNRGLPKKILRFWHSEPFNFNKIRFGWMPPHPTLYLRKSVYDEVGFFDESYKISGDYDLMLRVFICPNFSFYFIDEVLVEMKAGGVSNGSLYAHFLRLKEDWRALSNNGISPYLSLPCKSIRKLSQFIVSC